MRTSLWFSIIVIIYNLFTIVTTPHKTITKLDQCMSCHQETNDMDKSHPISIFGCAKYHEEVINRVKNSMMESLEGIQKVLEYQWSKKSTYLGKRNMKALADVRIVTG